MIPEGGTEYIMPAGYSVHFYSKLGRKSHVYRADWWEGDLAGISTVSKCADDGSKFGRGAWWGMGLGAEGLRKLLFEDSVQLDDLMELDRRGLTSLLSEYKLSTNHVRDEAGDVGSLIHGAIEDYFDTGLLPEEADFPNEARPKLRGAIKYLTECDPNPIHTEAVVASRETGIAGRFDFYGTEKGEPCLRDYKTGSYLKLEHGLQLAGYEGVGREAGFLPEREIDKAVVQIKEDAYEIHPCTYVYSDFLAYALTYRIAKRK